MYCFGRYETENRKTLTLKEKKQQKKKMHQNDFLENKKVKIIYSNENLEKHIDIQEKQNPSPTNSKFPEKINQNHQKFIYHKIK